MLAELPIHADAAEALSGVDDVAAHSWFQEMLRGGWNPNLPLADGLLLEDRFYLGPFPVELDLLVRCCGPEPGIAYLDPVSSWQPRVDAFAQMITAGFQMPLLAAGADLRLMDGNHRAAGALQAGVRRFPTIILFASPEERSRWAKEYLDGTLGRRLSGGHVTEVVRVSAAVRRSTTERSSFVWQLLADLERVDFAGAPRFVGVDGAGRETLSYIEGDVHPRGYQSLEQIRSAAALLRELHDATTGLSGAEGVLVIHGDPKPRNTVYDGQQAVAFHRLRQRTHRKRSRRCRLSRLAVCPQQLRRSRAARGTEGIARGCLRRLSTRRSDIATGLGCRGSGENAPECEEQRCTRLSEARAALARAPSPSARTLTQLR